MTASAAWTASFVRSFGNAADMSSPTSAIASTTSGFTWSAGSEPADRTTTRSAARCVVRSAAIWERPALWTQT